MAHKQNSRRSFLRKAGVASLGATSLPIVSTILPSCSPAEVEQPSNTGSTASYSTVVTRKNIADIPVDDPEIQLLKDGIRILQERSEKSPLDPMG